LESLEDEKGVEEKSKIDNVLTVLCFLIFALIGYLLIYYLSL